jgi:CTP:phosphocholine cytidylyltransferase-like protein
MKYKVLITTSGIGSRLGELTKFTNKSLVRIGKKPAISYIVESYPQNIPIVVTLGYYGNQVRDFLEMAYPSRKFTFVEVDKYKGYGSSLLYSMTKAEKYLNLPFIYHACDTIVSGNIPPPQSNWNGGFRGNGSSQYSSFDVLDGELQEIYGKGMLESDFLHIGLVGIKDYKEFWKFAHEYLKDNKNDSSSNDVVVIKKMLDNKIKFKAKNFSEWYDIGNVDGLNVARQCIYDSFQILDKIDETIYLFDKFVIKFFYNIQNVKNRVKRASILSTLVPKIIESRGNFYKYKLVKGTLLSEIFDPEDFNKFLIWSKNKLWKSNNEVSNKKFYAICKNFYFGKTLDRVENFLRNRSMKDATHLINGMNVPAVREMLNIIDWDWLCKAQQSKFHGDYILDNILKTKNGYCLLDWRQDFGGLLKSGDMYYDLGKLNHNLTLSHNIINKNLFTIRARKDGIVCDVLRKNNLVNCEKVFWKFVRENGYNENKIKIITALIWLSMSPLHSHPFDLFLFYFGKYNLWRAINEQN